VIQKSDSEKDCELAILGKEFSLVYVIDFDIESFLPAVLLEEGQSSYPSFSAWTKLFLYSVPTKLKRYKHVTIPYYEYFDNSTYTHNTAAYPNCNWKQFNKSDYIPQTLLIDPPPGYQSRKYYIRDRVEPDVDHDIPYAVKYNSGPVPNDWVDTILGGWRFGREPNKGTEILRAKWVRFRDHAEHQKP